MTGEAKKKGTKEEREAAAIKRKEAIDVAIETGGEAVGLVWMIIQCTHSIPLLDTNGAFTVDSDGSMKYGPDDEGWTNLLPVDVPEWVKENSLVGDLRKGMNICYNEKDGGRWYRGLLATQAKEDKSPKSGIIH